MGLVACYLAKPEPWGYMICRIVGIQWVRLSNVD